MVKILIFAILANALISTAFQRVGVGSALCRSRLSEPSTTQISTGIPDRKLRLEELNTNPRKIDVGEESIARFGKVST